jgi:HAD superfamily hydrolase (TIGR01509 family)
MSVPRFDTALFDVDGTLIDSNGAHAETWAQAFRDHGVQVAAVDIRPLIGMGGDKLIPAVAHVSADSPLGKVVSAGKKALFAELLKTLRPTPGARALIEFLRDQGVDLVVATSADDREMTALLEQAALADLMPQRASKNDASGSKPDPDIVHAAMARVGARPETSVLIGDTPYDIEAASRAGIPCIAFRSGGHWSDDDLGQATHLFDDPAGFLQALRQSERAHLYRNGDGHLSTAHGSGFSLIHTGRSSQ